MSGQVQAAHVIKIVQQLCRFLNETLLTEPVQYRYRGWNDDFAVEFQVGDRFEPRNGSLFELVAAHGPAREHSAAHLTPQEQVAVPGLVQVQVP